MSKLPAFQFYPGDWRKDLAVQSLSYHDRGVWHEIFCLMHDSEKRGVLLLNGKPMPTEVLARILGLDKQNLERTLETLISYGVAIEDAETGALMCEWMVKQEELRQIRAEAGKKGGNPILLKQNPSKTQANGEQNAKQNLTPSSSSSSSSSKTTETVVEKKAAATNKSVNRKISDSDGFLAEIKQNAAYAHIDVDQELAKARLWSATNNRQCTPKFFINWLNRIQKPIEPKESSIGTFKSHKDIPGLHRPYEGDICNIPGLPPMTRAERVN